MIQVLAALGGGTTLVSLGLIAFLVYKLVASKDAQLTLDKELNEEKGKRRTVESSLDLETAAHTETRRELAEEKDLRAAAEAQRNQAWREAREDAVNRIALLDPAAAAAYGNRILSAPLPGVRLSDTADGRLEKP